MGSENEILVSVIVPAYNSTATIACAVDSALDQNVPVEILVVDDGSGDDLAGALAKYRGDPRVKLLVNDRNRGVAYSRNRGVREASGAFVAFLDSDDWWEKGKLTAQLSRMEQTGAVLCCTGRELMNPDGSSRGRIISVEDRITYRSLLSHNSINCSSALIRSDVAREFPMEHDEAHEDYILWLKILRKYGYAAGIPHPYLKYRMMEGSKSGSKLNSARMTYLVYRHMGYSHPASCCFFLSYALHGVWKYWGK